MLCYTCLLKLLQFKITSLFEYIWIWCAKKIIIISVDNSKNIFVYVFWKLIIYLFNSTVVFLCVYALENAVEFES